MDEAIFIGLDGEMSGTDPSRHSLIQIGVAVSQHDYFEAKIGWDDFEFEPEALDAIGWSAESIADGLDSSTVDRQLAEWMGSRRAGFVKIVPVGWGVSYFDLPFVTRALPMFHGMLHHHSVELNAIAYALGESRTYLGRKIGFEGWKRAAKRAAFLQILNERGSAPKEHDACDDAILALLAWRWMSRVSASQDTNELSMSERS